MTTLTVPAPAAPAAPAAAPAASRLRGAVSAAAWRRARYALCSLPLALLAAAASVVSPGVARRYRALVRRSLGQPATPAPRRLVGRVLAHALIGLPVNAAATLVLGWLGYLSLINLAYPIRPLIGMIGFDPHAWGGPSYAGVWACHALAGGVPLLLLLLLTARAFTGLQSRLARTLLG
ncbi:hypothetical protein OG455_20145 [Kitasatospora sp. NBC_01287]|uniref:hypothetical protein n=1 Tax=Kitasatospora sp. NBC_01287 TaxID=2903573 RepID=UPI00225B13F0|nr:hypothetical protein [Kitasatospora sp. NBC_01287]MCX4747800.1 hypothetical protein [Kitasatospora sp. NBC_01287]